jgi:hypothetical protein
MCSVGRIRNQISRIANMTKAAVASSVPWLVATFKVMSCRSRNESRICRKLLMKKGSRRNAKSARTEAKSRPDSVSKA